MFRVLGLMLAAATLVAVVILAPSFRWLLPPDGVFAVPALLSIATMGICAVAGARARFDWLAPLALAPLLWFAPRFVSAAGMSERVHDVELLLGGFTAVEREFGFACLFAAASSFAIAGAAFSRPSRTIAPALLIALSFALVGMGVAAVFVASATLRVEALDAVGVAAGESIARRALIAAVTTALVTAAALSQVRRRSEATGIESKPLLLTCMVLLLAMGFWPAITQLVPVSFPVSDVQAVVLARRPDRHTAVLPTGVLHKDGVLEGGDDVLIVDRWTPWRLTAPALKSLCRATGNEGLSLAAFAGAYDLPAPAFALLRRFASSWRYGSQNMLCAGELPSAGRVIHFGGASEITVTPRGDLEVVDVPIADARAGRTPGGQFRATATREHCTFDGDVDFDGVQQVVRSYQCIVVLQPAEGLALPAASGDVAYPGRRASLPPPPLTPIPSIAPTPTEPSIQVTAEEDVDGVYWRSYRDSNVLDIARVGGGRSVGPEPPGSTVGVGRGGRWLSLDSKRQGALGPEQRMLQATPLTRPAAPPVTLIDAPCTSHMASAILSSDDGGFALTCETDPLIRLLYSTRGPPVTVRLRKPMEFVNGITASGAVLLSRNEETPGKTIYDSDMFHLVWTIDRNGERQDIPKLAGWPSLKLIATTASGWRFISETAGGRKVVVLDLDATGALTADKPQALPKGAALMDVDAKHRIYFRLPAKGCVEEGECFTLHRTDIKEPIDKRGGGRWFFAQ